MARERDHLLGDRLIDAEIPGDRRLGPHDERRVRGGRGVCQRGIARENVITVRLIPLLVLRHVALDHREANDRPTRQLWDAPRPVPHHDEDADHSGQRLTDPAG